MDVLQHPSPALGVRAPEVDPVNDDTLQDLVVEMARAMYEAPGIGLAATQIGVMKRVVVYDLDDEGKGLVAICNPEIVEKSGECELEEEGCLSVPGITVPVTRACKVTCEALTIDGTPIRIEAEGLHARLLQHEIDHLDGFLIIDRADPEERKAALKRYREACEMGAKPGQTSI
jgi:peptide deformylase